MKILFNPYTKFNFNPSFNSFKKQDSYVQKYNGISRNDYKNYSNAIKNQNLLNFGNNIISEETKNNIIKLSKEENITQTEIAKRVGCSVAYVNYFLSKNGIHIPNKSEILKDKIIELNNQQLTRKEIAEQLGCSYSLVVKVLKSI